MKKEENISPTPLAKSFQLVNNLSDLEQGRFYTINKDGSFVKKVDGIQSIPGKDSPEGTSEDYLINDNTPLNKFKKFLFSTYGLVILVTLIILTGIALGLIPVFLNKSNNLETLVITENNYQITNTDFVTTESETILSSTTTTTTTKTTSTTTTSSTTILSTELTSQEVTTEILTTFTTTITIPTTIQEATTNPLEVFTTFVETTPEETTILEIQETTIEQIVTTEKSCEIDLNPKSLIPSDYNYNSCPSSSIYNPKFLSLTDSYNFNYPINQIIVCTESKLDLKCPSNQVLHIYSAYYGIQPDTNTYTCNKKSTNHEICYFDLTFSNLTTICEQQNSCEINVNVGSFGDPCINSKNKQLFIQYQCIDNDNYNLISSCELNTNKSSICPQITNGQYEKINCNSNPFTIECPDDQVIKILCAFYGLDPNLRCPGTFYYGSPSACYSKQSYNLVYENCNGKQNCTFSDDTNTKYDIGFNEVCPGYLNMLLIQWECVSTQVTTEAPQTTKSTLPICNSTPSINGTCDTSYSPYVPQALNNSTKTYFSYPIYQQIVCQGSTLILVCPADTVIHIYAGYFGIQEYTKSSICTPDYETPFMLYLAESFTIINSTCESKNKCSLRAFPLSMGGTDLNSAFYKQLVVQYQCVNPIVLENEINKCEINKEIPLICPKLSRNTGINEITVCEGNPLSISCSTGRIQVQCAFYGIHPSLTTCDVPSLAYKPVCYFSSSFTKMSDLCNFRSTCSIAAAGSNTFQPDPCNGLKKALYVQWRYSDYYLNANAPPLLKEQLVKNDTRNLKYDFRNKDQIIECGSRTKSGEKN
ncbi:unnamed protein product [Brachionus calyciflorus]|uniref:SUEL-type lectin domain-containing protein n=1 Tax=Brachionus calyciflorus TaxID=104777 RepID=A0A813QQ56_9BILA|nr:unnamed protein product [Brachionus calyciflorus]